MTGPSVVMPGRTFRKVAAGEAYVLALATDGALFAFGNNQFAKLGVGQGVGGERCLSETNPCDSDADCEGSGSSCAAEGFCRVLCVPQPTQLATIMRFVAIATGIYHSAALRDDGQVMTWGATRRRRPASPRSPRRSAGTATSSPRSSRRSDGRAR